MYCIYDIVQRSTRFVSVVIGLMLVLLNAPTLLDAQDAEKQKREELDRGMRMRANATNVVQLADSGRIINKPSADPLFSFSDEPRDILKATLWAYGTPGRPVALQKIEVYHRPEGPKWFYCMTSLSEDLIETNWRDGQEWSSKQPGTKFHNLPDGPQPARTDFARLFQMKQLANRFDATLVDVPNDLRTPMRRLKTPIYRYSDRVRGIQDGVIFGYTVGTNPDALLSIELHRKGDAKPTWTYGLARITLCELTVKLDDKQVWQVPYVYPQGPGRPAMFDTWLFFYEADLNEVTE